MTVALTPDWVGEFEFAVQEENPEGEFKANMVTNFESDLQRDMPGEKFPQLGINLDSLIYTEHGGRRLGTVPPGLIVLG